MTSAATEHIGKALEEVMGLTRQAFEAVNDRPPVGSSLDQVFLIDGDTVVTDYLQHGEWWLAFDHLIYMIEEPPFPLSQTTYEHLQAAARELGVPPERLQVIRPSWGHVPRPRR